jgi:hypothetical protein
MSRLESRSGVPGHAFRAVGAALFALACAATAVAAPTETGDIRLEEGFVDPQSGVRVDKVVTDPATGMQEIHFAVPRPEPATGVEQGAGADTGAIDEVVVTGHRPERKFTLPQLKPHEFVRDYDHDHYGLVIYLGKHESVPLRLYMDSRQADPRTTPP